VLSDISFQVDKGETVCVLGPSGSGKSTLLRCINWLERPDAGQVYLNGMQVGINGAGVVMKRSRTVPIRTPHRHGVPAFCAVAASHRAAEPDGSPYSSAAPAEAEVRDGALALLSKVGLLEKQNAFPAKLSGGQKQRVGIARALAMRPDLLLFDEPTSALDPELVGEVLLVMRDLAREGRTMVIVTHEMAFAREAATRILFLDRGRVIEAPPPGSLFRAPPKPNVRGNSCSVTPAIPPGSNGSDWARELKIRNGVRHDRKQNRNPGATRQGRLRRCRSDRHRHQYPWRAGGGHLGRSAAPISASSCRTNIPARTAFI